jgi:hypothetical protein
MKKKHYHTVGTVPKSNREVVETEAKKIPLSHIYMTPNTYIHDLYHIYTWPLTFLAWYKYKLKQHYFKNAKPPSKSGTYPTYKIHFCMMIFLSFWNERIFERIPKYTSHPETQHKQIVWCEMRFKYSYLRELLYHKQRTSLVFIDTRTFALWLPNISF